jgi:hypothetical protein
MKPKFYPSAYSRWGTCTASPTIIADYLSQMKAQGAKPPERSKYADEGVFAHELHAMCLMLDDDPYSYVGKTITVKGTGDFEVTMPVADAVNDSMQYVLDRSDNQELYVEYPVDLNWIAPIGKGVIDVGVIIDNGETVTVKIMDYKNGKGVRVDAKRNPELLLHAAGLIHAELATEQKSRLGDIELHIMQPNIGHFDCYVCTKKELDDFVIEVAMKYNEAIDEQKMKIVPSIDGCRFCDIKNNCVKLKESIFGKVLLDPTGISVDFKEPALMSNDELSELYPWLEFISAWTGNVKEFMVKQAISNNVEYRGLKLIEGPPGHRNWKDEKEAIEHMKQQELEEFEIYEKKLISPAKYETQVGKRNVGEHFKNLISQNKGSPKLVTEDTPGKSLKEAGIDEFNDI